MKKLTKILSLLLAVITLFGLMPVTASAACSHNWTKIYVIENEKMHSYKSKCSICGEVKEGWGYSGWEDHSYRFRDAFCFRAFRYPRCGGR